MGLEVVGGCFPVLSLLMEVVGGCFPVLSFLMEVLGVDDDGGGGVEDVPGRDPA